MHGLIERHQSAIAEVCRRHGVRKLDVVDSAARGIDFDLERSDVDFVVEFDPREDGPTLRTYFALRNELPILLGRRVDLVMSNSVTNPYLKAELERTRESIYAA